MAYTDDAVLAKLSALNESHDSIANAAQWIMFHRRRADRTVQLWLQKLKDSPSPKRLNLIYLANEVTQQSKARNKDDFIVAFSPVIADAMATAYKGASTEVQNKLRKVVLVWKERSILEAPIQAAVEARIEDLEKARGSTKPGFGGSIFGGSSSSSAPAELNPLIAPQQKVSKLLLSVKSEVSSADQEYEKVTDPANMEPRRPVYAARLNGLLKKLATAEGAVQECVKARTELVQALEKMLDSNRAELSADEAKLVDLGLRKKDVDAKKQAVELEIISGLASKDNEQAREPGGNPAPEPDRPEVEALTPPPAGDEPDIAGNGSHAAATPPTQPAKTPSHHASPVVPQPAVFQPSAAPGIEMLSNLASQYQAVPISTNGANKKRKIDASDDFPDLGNDDGIDADVAEMLRKDSQGA